MINLQNMQDDGFETVRLVDAEGGQIFECSLDLWEVHNHLADLTRKYRDKPAYEYHGAIVEYLTSKGFPEVSHRFADRFAAGIFERVQSLKNSPAGAPSLGSPASTGSTPSA